MPQNPPRSLEEILAGMRARRGEAPSTGTPTAPQKSIFTSAPPPAEEEGGGFWGKYIAPIVRGAPGFIGGPWGAAASVVGEGVAEKMEGRDLSPGEMALEGALGFIPMKGGSLIKAILKGAGLAAADTGARDVITGNTDNILGDMTRSGVMGGMSGGALGALSKYISSRGTVEPPVPTAAPRAPKKPVDASKWQSPEPTEGLSFQPPDPRQIVPPSRGPLSGGPAPRATRLGRELQDILPGTDELKFGQPAPDQFRGTPPSRGPIPGRTPRTLDLGPEGSEGFTGRAPRVGQPSRIEPVPAAPAYEALRTPKQNDLFADPNIETQPPPAVRASDPLDDILEIVGRRDSANAQRQAERGAAWIESEGNRRADARSGGRGTWAPDPAAPVPQTRSGATSVPVPEATASAPSSSPAASGKPKAPAGLYQEWAMRRKQDMDFDEDFPSYVTRKMQAAADPNPNDMPWRERQSAKTMNDRYQHLVGSDEGAINLGAIKAGLPSGAELESLRYASLLSSPLTHLKNVAGNVGAVGMHAAERAVTGDVKGATDVLREMFSGKTIADVGREYRNPALAVGRSGHAPAKGILGVPGRAMGAIDAATKDALKRGGLNKAQADDITFTNEPHSASGKALVEFTQRAPLSKLVVPFARTAVNIAERGLERTPGVGLLPAVRKMTNASGRDVAGRQGLGLLATLIGAAQAPSDGKEPQGAPSGGEQLLDAFAAPYALPKALGEAVGTKLHKKGATFSDAAKAGVKGFVKSLPVPQSERAYDPSQILAQFVPNILRDISPVESKKFETSKGFLDPAIAKIPWLNEAMLKRKPGKAGRDR